jgi:Domain of unknown function (DUF4124)
MAQPQYTRAYFRGVNVSSSQRTAKRTGRAAVVTAGLFLASVMGPLQADQVYKSVDAQGHVTYSDRPNSSAAQKTDVAVQQADPAEAARLAKERQLLNAEDDQRKKQQADDSRAKAQQQHDKRAKCQVARDYYNSLKNASRVYKNDADGNRVYLSDTELDAKREAARQVMDTACGT